MKHPKLLLVLAVVMILAAGLISAGPNALVRFEWDYPYPDTDVTGFVLHTSDDVLVPFTNWVAIELYSGQMTNGAVRTNGSTLILPGKHFFYLTASNFWGESGPSNVTNTPAVAGGVRVKRIVKEQ